MATPLQRPLSHPNGCLILQRLVLPVVTGGHRQAGHFLRNHSLFEFVNAERLSDLIVSLLPRVLRQCALASLGQNRSTYQFAMDRPHH